MQNKTLIFGVSLAAIILVVPFLFNSCQQGFHARQQTSNMASSARSLSEINDLCNGGGTNHQLKSISNISNQKIQLDQSFVNSKTSHKEVVAIIDTQCVKKGDSGAITNHLGITDLDLKLKKKALTLQVANELQQTLDQAEADPCVLHVFENHSYSKQSTKMSFSDSLNNQQLHFDAINAYEAYPILYDSNSGIATISNQRDVIFAVIDSGVDSSHPDLFNNIWTFNDPTNGAKRFGIDATTLNSSTSVVYDASDEMGHGTHVAGLIAANSNNTMGTTGAMPFRAQIMAIKVFAKITDPATGNTYFNADSAAIVNGIRWAAAQGADVINLSIGRFASEDLALRGVIEEVLPAGVTVITTIGNGNGNQPAQEITKNGLSIIPGIFGADYQGVITVAATQAESGMLAAFSHYSTTFAEIAAPGTQAGGGILENGLLSTFPMALSNNNGYVPLEGTSQAAPLVAAGAGLVIAYMREKTGSTPHPCIVEEVIKSGAMKSGVLSDYVSSGNHLDLLGIAELLDEHYNQ